MHIVIFTIAEKEYGIDIKQVRQVTRTQEVIPIPDAADFVEGVINLRGKVIPLVNLRKKFGLEKEEAKSANRIIITDINKHGIGILVDRVVDVLVVDEGSVTTPDEVLKDAQYLTGVAKVGNRLILMIDIHKVLTSEDQNGIDKVHERIEIKRTNA